MAAAIQKQNESIQRKCDFVVRMKKERNTEKVAEKARHLEVLLSFRRRGETGEKLIRGRRVKEKGRKGGKG